MSDTPAASSNCPICGHDSPHPHSDESIHAWLMAQASRFGLSVFVCNKADTHAIAAYRLSEEEQANGRAAFEVFVKEHYSAFPHWTLQRNRDMPEQYMSITVEANWRQWQKMWCAAHASRASSHHISPGRTP